MHAWSVALIYNQINSHISSTRRIIAKEIACPKLECTAMPADNGHLRELQLAVSAFDGRAGSGTNLEPHSGARRCTRKLSDAYGGRRTWKTISNLDIPYINWISERVTEGVAMYTCAPTKSK